jgi:hypothetical protein
MIDRFPLFPSKSEPLGGRDRLILHGSNKGNSVKSFLQKFQPGMCYYENFKILKTFDPHFIHYPAEAQSNL